MIKHFVKVSLKDPKKGNVNQTIQTRNSLVLDFPCLDVHDCTPYVLSLSTGVYQFECWGSKGGNWGGSNGVIPSKPGVGGYTSGRLYISKPATFFVYIGNIGFFNSVKFESIPTGNFVPPGGATDVRLNYSENWWDNYSLISRIMVAAGGGAAEWKASIGGNGGGLNGGNSTSAIDVSGSEVFDERCLGATQTSGSECTPLSGHKAVKGEFGSAGKAEPYTGFGEIDTGGFGGGGYYGGTSYQYSFAGSGGSSFISGHEGCNSVKDQTEFIEHTNQPNHYSGFVFKHTKMICGNETMPLPTSSSEEGIHSGEGAFRITLLLYQCKCTSKQSLYSSLIPFLYTLISFS